MCITFGEAKLFQTTVAAWYGRRRGTVFHGLGYQNTAQHLARPDFHPDRPGNAMAFAIPARPGTLGSRNFLNMEKTPHVLENMAQAIKPPVFRGGDSLSFKGIGSEPQVLFFVSGIYSIFVSQQPELIPGEITRRLADGSLDPERAPFVDPLLLPFYETYTRQPQPAWPVAVFCFSNREAARSQPIVVVYEPLFPSWLYAPAVDSHSGGHPDLNELVDVDHTVLFGINEHITRVSEEHKKVRYSDDLSQAVREVLPTHVIGRSYRQQMTNGDFLLSLNDLQLGHPGIVRRQPSFWHNLQPA